MKDNLFQTKKFHTYMNKCVKRLGVTKHLRVSEEVGETRKDKERGERY